ncbi:MAG: GNAT family N-acetyltransferase [Rhodospirillales bacterium]|nr:MAG: GNAT family N-acetyltransferase [Rhodospirillales bacterium]
MDFAISDLRDRPAFLDVVADRVWRAWWKPRGHPLERVAGGLRAALDAGPLPFAVVAHDGGAYLGSTLGVASDLDERPGYTPWVAAVWVEPAHRLRSVGRSLVGHAAGVCFARGFPRAYLCASVERRDFYVRQGWVPIEADVGPHRQTVYTMDAPAPAATGASR